MAKNKVIRGVKNMRVLIIENEAYLAQNIANKLSDLSLECEILPDMKDIKKEHYDVILASFSTINERYADLSKEYPDSIVILMIAYISEDTVTKPLKSGVTDYIVKPFIVDELIRKISHYRKYKDMYDEISFYRDYFNFIQKDLGIPDPKLYKPPLVIKSNTQRSADIYAMRYAREQKVYFSFFSLKYETWKSILKNPPKKSDVYYITNLEELKKIERKEFLEVAIKYNIIVSFVSAESIAFPQVIDITQTYGAIEFGGDILSIKEYEKLIISKFENRYPDIELAKKLGMSRKSLWEKRKKYGIIRKKDEDI